MLTSPTSAYINSFSSSNLKKFWNLPKANIYRLIVFWLLAEQFFLIPFMGSGSTAIAALKGNRRYLGYEIEAHYVRLAEKRIRQFILEFKSPSLLDLLGE
ncbi:MAG: site-specific DNA-methyltransferase [Desulfobacterales bacterium]|nr:site-specific DNA-methyltransferase [Desulfobacterales bacterium]